jgi:NAD-dependent SIR2 family protein deacetylase
MINSETMQNIARAATIIANADTMLICAGAGMSVDCGLPSFRGIDGLWTVTHSSGKSQYSFMDIAQPKWFHYRPELVWGFYGWRLAMYREAVPHAGYVRLLGWMIQKSTRGFVYTSNIDGLFLKAGFDAESMVECHGSIHHLQCSKPCHHDIWEAAGVNILVDGETKIAEQPLPRCTRCRRVSRPNVLMFDDFAFARRRVKAQLKNFDSWLYHAAGLRVAILEIGAGDAIPRVRDTAAAVATLLDADLIRINPVGHFSRPNIITIPLGVLEATRLIAKELSQEGTVKS